MSRQHPTIHTGLTRLWQILLSLCLIGWLTGCQNSHDQAASAPPPVAAPSPGASPPAPPPRAAPPAATPELPPGKSLDDLAPAAGASPPGDRPDKNALDRPNSPKKNGKPKKAAQKPATDEPSTDLPVAAAPPPDEEIPQFDWPPPKASAQESIPDKWLRTGTAPTLAEVADKFEKAIKLAGYRERSYYAVPNGFALATQLEHIQPDGTPLPGDDRWTVGTPRVGNLSLLAFIKALASAPPGVYRVIVFVVTDAPWKQSPSAPGEQQVMDWPGGGATGLPVSIGNLPFGENYRAEALVYEFRKGQSGPAQTILPSQVSGETHLTKGGLWRLLSIL